MHGNDGMDEQFPNMANAIATPRHVKIALCILHLRLIFTHTSLGLRVLNLFLVNTQSMLSQAQLATIPPVANSSALACPEADLDALNPLSCPPLAA